MNLEVHDGEEELISSNWVSNVIKALVEECFGRCKQYNPELADSEIGIDFFSEGCSYSYPQGVISERNSSGAGELIYSFRLALDKVFIRHESYQRRILSTSARSLGVSIEPHVMEPDLLVLKISRGECLRRLKQIFGMN